MEQLQSPIWLQWQQLGAQQRVAALLEWQQALDLVPAQWRQLAAFQCRQMLRLSALEQSLPSPSGESNEYYLSGRGLVFVYSTQGDDDYRWYVATIAALAAGNAVQLASDFPELDSMLASFSETLYLRQLPADGLLTGCECIDLQHQLASHQYAALCYYGEAELAQAIRLQLAEGDGPIIPFICEVLGDPQASLTHPDFLLQLVCERTRTTNLTAIGGNTELLTLGSKA
ncbi:hypothetical protein [Aliagarivorans marinus]|uniref:hypothetical protein n=1 Tax=Aliagarivorans marinus TaxID=561965 RepID=UPI0003F66CF5|nr:hypothetical protein [Aliagarivorans marinus]